MNKLSAEKRVQILAMLCEGASMRSISRVCDVSINTVGKMLSTILFEVTHETSLRENHERLSCLFK